MSRSLSTDVLGHIGPGRSKGSVSEEGSRYYLRQVKGVHFERERPEYWRRVNGRWRERDE